MKVHDGYQQRRDAKLGVLLTRAMGMASHRGSLVRSIHGGVVVAMPSTYEVYPW